MASNRPTPSHRPKLPDPPEAPLPLRQGPRPLPLHLAAATMAWTSSLAVLPLLRSGSIAWRGELKSAAQNLVGELAEVKPEEFAAAVSHEAERRLAAFLDGLATYRRHRYRRALPSVPTVWQEGTTHLLDYATGGQGPAVLVVPSLINRAYILDLVKDRSFMRFLAAEGFRPYLVEWDVPGEMEREFSLDDYIVERLARALDVVREASGVKPIVIGYCMGGLLALGLAQNRQRDLAGVAFLATPWDFHAERADQAILIGALAPQFEPLLQLLGELPVDVIQALFAALDPSLTLRKFLSFAGLDPNSDRARQFVALEDWLNDGVSLSGPVARETLGEWYGRNATARGQWCLAGRPVKPEGLYLPSIAVIPDQDRIVPPGSALALARLVPHCRILRPATGHIGMMAGAKAESEVWQPLAAWMREQGVSCTAAKRPVLSPKPSSGKKASRRTS